MTKEQKLMIIKAKNDDSSNQDQKNESKTENIT